MSREDYTGVMGLVFLLLGFATMVLLMIPPLHPDAMPVEDLPLVSETQR